MKISRYLLLAAILPASFCSQAMAQDSIEFESPVAIEIEGKQFNSKNSIMYPSPAIFDVDNDGKDEMVIGSISGRLFVSENVAKSSGEPEWGKIEQLKGANGKNITLSNW